MATNRIKGITIEIGGDTTKLGKALNDTDRSLYKVSKDLKEVERLLKLDPTNVDLLAQKGRLLAERAELSANRVKMLETASAQLDDTLSKTQLDDFNLELDITKSKADMAAKAVEEFDPTLNKLGESADELSDSLDSVDGSTSDMGDGFTVAKGIAADLASGGIKFLADKALELVSTLFTLDEATEEYRESLGLINTAFETAGYGPEVAKEAYRGFYEILGETDTATEASQLLAQLATDEEDVAKWIDIAAGVYGTFGDSLPIEGLIEAANETAKTGKVTGNLADALNWVGISEESVNEQLGELANSTERTRYLMGLLSQQYGDAADSFYKNNEELIEARNAQADLDDMTSQLGESVANLKNTFFETFGPFLTDLIEIAIPVMEGLGWVIEKVGDALAFVRDLVFDLGQAFGNFISGVFGIGNKNSPISISEGISPRAILVPDTLDVPAFSAGGVAKKNNPFLAVVGDNTQEDEIIAPYSLVKRAAAQGVAESGMLRGGHTTQNATMSLDGRTFARLIFPYIQAESRRLGVKIST